MDIEPKLKYKAIVDYIDGICVCVKLLALAYKKTSVCFKKA